MLHGPATPVAKNPPGAYHVGVASVIAGSHSRHSTLSIGIIDEDG